MQNIQLYFLTFFSIITIFSVKALRKLTGLNLVRQSIKQRAVPAHIVETHQTEERPRTRQDERKKHLKRDSKAKGTEAGDRIEDTCLLCDKKPPQEIPTICNYTTRLLYIIYYRYSNLIFAQSRSLDKCIYFSSSESIDILLIINLSVVLNSVYHSICEGVIIISL